MDTDDLLIRFEECSSWIQEGVDEYKGTIEAVNTLIVVAAFIAGVQAQLIAITLQLSRNRLSRACNLVAFIGLMLEIIGTFPGAVHSVILQRKMRQDTRTINSMTQYKADLKAVLKKYVRKEQEKSGREKQEKEKREEEKRQARRERRRERRRKASEEGRSKGVVLRDLQERGRDELDDEEQEGRVGKVGEHDIQEEKSWEESEESEDQIPRMEHGQQCQSRRTNFPSGKPTCPWQPQPTIINSCNTNISTVTTSFATPIDEAEDTEERLKRLEVFIGEMRKRQWSRAQLGIIEIPRDIVVRDITAGQSSSTQQVDSRAYSSPFATSCLAIYNAPRIYAW